MNSECIGIERKWKEWISLNSDVEKIKKLKTQCANFKTDKYLNDFSDRKQRQAQEKRDKGKKFRLKKGKQS